MKKISILLALFLITGCTAKYELKIYDDSIEESIKLTVDSEHYEYISSFENIITNNESTSTNIYEYNFDEKTGLLDYYYKYNFDSFENSTALSSCFSTYSVISESDYYLIQTGSGFRCLPYQYSDYDYFDYDELAIQITTNHKVINDNADEVKNNTYYWYINEENKDTKVISFKISRDEKIVNPYYSMEFIIFIAGITTIGGIITLVIFIKNKKNNKL